MTKQNVVRAPALVLHAKHTHTEEEEMKRSTNGVKKIKFTLGRYAIIRVQYEMYLDLK